MGQLFAYSITVSLTLMLCFGGYAIGRGGSPRLRRTVLLAIYAIALIAVPALLDIQPRPGADLDTDITHDATLLPEVLMSNNSGISTLSVILTIYIIGIAACLVMTAAELLKIFTIIIGAKKRTIGNRKVYVHNRRDIAPFSIGRMIILYSDDATNASIMAHEAAHISCHHTLDLMVAQLAAALCWYCPAAWKLRRELLLIHEFQADGAVISHGEDPSGYSRLLVERAAGFHTMAIANSFNHNNLKQRIQMMQTPDFRKRGGKLRVLLPLAAMALSVILLSVPTISNAVEQISLSELAVRGINAKNTPTPAFVIYGVDHYSDPVKNGNFMTVADFSTSEITASDVDGVILPNINAIFCINKEVLHRLTPNVKKVMVDGKIMSVKEFSKIPASQLSKVIVSGEAMIVLTRNQLENSHFNSLEDAINAENK